MSGENGHGRSKADVGDELGQTLQRIEDLVETNKIDEAYKLILHTNYQLKFANNIQWFLGIDSFFKNYVNKTPAMSKDPEFNVHYFYTLRNITMLLMSSRSRKDYGAIADTLNRLDQQLWRNTSLFTLDTIWRWTFLEIKAQFYFLIGYYLIETTQNIGQQQDFLTYVVGACLFASFKANGEEAMTHVGQPQRKFVQWWYHQSQDRLSQIGHLLKHLSKGEVLEWSTRHASAAVKGKLFDIFVLVFGQSDDARRKHSYFLHASEMHSNTLTSRINPMSDGQAIAYDTASFKLHLNDLSHLVWLCLQYFEPGKNYQPVYPFFVIDDLPPGLCKFDLPNGLIKSLCQMDILVFLLATVYCVNNQIRLDESQNDSRLLLPPLASYPLCSEDQARWWSEAYHFFNHTESEQRQQSNMRKILTKGIETVRLIGLHGMSLTLMVHIARSLSKITQLLNEKNVDSCDLELVATEEREKIFWEAVIKELGRLKRHEDIELPEDRLFKHSLGARITLEGLKEIQDEAYFSLGSIAYNHSKYKQAVELFEKAYSPEAQLQLAKSYKKLAEEEQSENMSYELSAYRAREVLFNLIANYKYDKGFNKTVLKELDDIDWILHREHFRNIEETEESFLQFSPRSRTLSDRDVTGGARKKLFSRTSPGRPNVDTVRHEPSSVIDSNSLTLCRSQPSTELLTEQITHLNHTCLDLQRNIHERNREDLQNQELILSMFAEQSNHLMACNKQIFDELVESRKMMTNVLSENTQTMKAIKECVGENKTSIIEMKEAIKTLRSEISEPQNGPSQSSSNYATQRRVRSRASQPALNSHDTQTRHEFEVARHVDRGSLEPRDGQFAEAYDQMTENQWYLHQSNFLPEHQNESLKENMSVTSRQAQNPITPGLFPTASAQQEYRHSTQAYKNEHLLKPHTDLFGGQHVQRMSTQPGNVMFAPAQEGLFMFTTHQGSFMAIPTQQGPFMDKATQQVSLGATPTQQGSFMAIPTQQGPFMDKATQQVPFMTAPTQQVPFITTATQQGPFMTAPTQQIPFMTTATQQGPFMTAPTQQGPFMDKATHQVSLGATPTQQGSFMAIPTQQGPFMTAPIQQGPFMTTATQQGPFMTAPRQQGPFMTTATQQGPFMTTATQQGPFITTATQQGPFVTTATHQGNDMNAPLEQANLRYTPTKERNAVAGPLQKENAIATTTQQEVFDISQTLQHQEHSFPLIQNNKPLADPMQSDISGQNVPSVTENENQKTLHDKIPSPKTQELDSLINKHNSGDLAQEISSHSDTPYSFKLFESPIKSSFKIPKCVFDHFGVENESTENPSSITDTDITDTDIPSPEIEQLDSTINKQNSGYLVEEFSSQSDSSQATNFFESPRISSWKIPQNVFVHSDVENKSIGNSLSITYADNILGQDDDIQSSFTDDISLGTVVESGVMFYESPALLVPEQSRKIVRDHEYYERFSSTETDNTIGQEDDIQSSCTDDIFLGTVIESGAMFFESPVVLIEDKSRRQIGGDHEDHETSTMSEARRYSTISQDDDLVSSSTDDSCSEDVSEDSDTQDKIILFERKALPVNGEDTKKILSNGFISNLSGSRAKQTTHSKMNSLVSISSFGPQPNKPETSLVSNNSFGPQPNKPETSLVSNSSFGLQLSKPEASFESNSYHGTKPGTPITRYFGIKSSEMGLSGQLCDFQFGPTAQNFSGAQLSFGPQTNIQETSLASNSSFGLQLSKPEASLASNSSFGLQLSKPEASLASNSSFGLQVSKPEASLASNSSFGLELSKPETSLASNSSFGLQLSKPEASFESKSYHGTKPGTPLTRCFGVKSSEMGLSGQLCDFQFGPTAQNFSGAQHNSQLRFDSVDKQNHELSDKKIENIGSTSNSKETVPIQASSFVEHVHTHHVVSSIHDDAADDKTSYLNNTSFMDVPNQDRVVEKRMDANGDLPDSVKSTTSEVGSNH
uniref:Uncharacterized protein n=1 Tax=Biomphalaria glabrata TaxID=6526 RepID=A0A2C9M2V0_BIOGL